MICELKARNTRGLLALMRSPNFGSQRALRLTLNLHSEAMLDLDALMLERDRDKSGRPDLLAHGLTSALARAVTERERIRWRELIESATLDVNAEWATRELERQRALGARVISFYDVDYPPLLRLTPRPPLVIFTRGALEPLRASRAQVTYELAIVGTRRPSSRAVERADQAARVTIARGGAVISGLALGVDGIAHRAALDAGGYTVAVLGHGLDRCYPDAHHDLAADIIASGGALISEQPWGVEPLPRCLVARDRIQAGLAAGVWIAETSARGGSLHAGRAALACRVSPRALALPRDHHASLSHLPLFNDTAHDPIHWSSGLTLTSKFHTRCQERSHALHQRAALLLEALNQSSGTPQKNDQLSLF